MAATDILAPLPRGG